MVSNLLEGEINFSFSDLPLRSADSLHYVFLTRAVFISLRIMSQFDSQSRRPMLSRAICSCNACMCLVHPSIFHFQCLPILFLYLFPLLSLLMMHRPPPSSLHTFQLVLDFTPLAHFLAVSSLCSLSLLFNDHQFFPFILFCFLLGISLAFLYVYVLQSIHFATFNLCSPVHKSHFLDHVTLPLTTYVFVVPSRLWGRDFLLSFSSSFRNSPCKPASARFNFTIISASRPFLFLCTHVYIKCSTGDHGALTPCTPLQCSPYNMMPIVYSIFQGKTRPLHRWWVSVDVSLSLPTEFLV